MLLRTSDALCQEKELLYHHNTSHNSASAFVDSPCCEYETRMITLLSILGFSSLGILFCMPLYVLPWDPFHLLAPLYDHEGQPCFSASPGAHYHVSVDSKMMFVVFVTSDTSSPRLVLETMSRPMKQRLAIKGIRSPMCLK